MQAEFLIFQAKSFYNAYLNLERIDCRYAFEEGVPSFDFRFLAALANASIRGLLTHYDVKLVQMQEKPMTDEELDKMIEDNRQHYIEKNISYIAKQKKESLS